jgi:hypothetical protein
MKESTVHHNELPEPKSNGVPAADAQPGPSEAAVATQPVTAGRPKARASGNARLLNYALAGAVVLAIAGVAFAAGRVTAPAAITAGNFPGGNGGQFPFPSGGFPGGNRPGGGTGGPGGGLLGAGGVTVEGTVESISDTTLTLTTADGRTIQIALDGTTAYHAQTDATAADVTTGTKVQVRLDLGGQGGAGNGTGASANDVTVVP